MTPLTADRHDAAAMERAVREVVDATGGRIDLVADVIAFTPEDALQDLQLFAGRTDRLVLVSSDFVYDPLRRRFPQRETDAAYLSEGYGGAKRAAEEVLLAAGTQAVPWVVVRPGHIYGPGSRLGCLPPVGRDPDLIGKLRRGDAIELVGAGHYLQQPVFVSDLARTILSLDAEPAVGRILNVAGPDIAESVDYYRFAAEALGVELRVTEIPVEAYRAEHPERASFLCHRFYDLSLLEQTGAAVPDTPLREGIGRHVTALLAEA